MRLQPCCLLVFCDLSIGNTASYIPVMRSRGTTGSPEDQRFQFLPVNGEMASHFHSAVHRPSAPWERGAGSI